MTETAQLSLPLIMPSQAQKHVTINEALAKLDAFAQLRLSSSTAVVPPEGPAAGQSYLVPLAATDAWFGRTGQIATYVNGGWVFTVPKAGWRAWDEQAGVYRTFDGVNWIEGAIATGSSGAGSKCLIMEADHSIESGATNETAFTLPTPSLVVGVTGRVVDEIVGVGITSWRLGVPTSDSRYGEGLGLELNSYVLGLTTSPLVYFTPTPFLISGEGGAFTGGTIRLAIHYIELLIPRAV